MDTDGIVNMRFAVEIEPKTPNDNPPPRVNTGDYTRITMWVAIMMASAVILLILAIISKKKDRKETYNEKH